MNKQIVLASIALLPIISGCGVEQVNEGYRGIKTYWGKVEGEPLVPGLYFYNPVSSSVFEMDVRERKIEGVTESFTRDTQKVMVSYTVTIYPEPTKIGALYSQFGRSWDERVINQTILGSIKDTIGQIIADDLVSKREAAKNAAEKELKTSLSSRGIIVTRLDFTNLNFDDAYEKAVEAKVVATQRAAEAKNYTIQVEEQAKQKVTTAKADAEAMRIKSNALSQNRGLVEYEIATKWDGKLPTTIIGGSTVPMINLDSLTKKH